MYLPRQFREDDEEALERLLNEHSFATLISQHQGAPFATHLPLLLERRGKAGGRGQRPLIEERVLRGHMARANPQWRSFGEAEVLVIFQGPDAYISPAWYGEADHHVPTWNYVAVHAYGIPRLIEEEEALSALVAATAARYEPKESGWRYEALPEELRRGLLRAIVGFEIPIARLEGKLKLSQNRSASERAGVIEALLQSPSDRERALGELMRAREGGPRPSG